ncbi:MAG: LysM peptidoglycan-binding domain-containing protein [Phycisphaerales bacterium]
MTRENKLAMVIGFGLLLFVGILVSDHLSARTDQIGTPLVAVKLPPKEGLPGGQAPAPIPFGRELDRVQPPTAPNDGQFPLVADPMPGMGETMLPPAPAAEESRERTHTVAKGEYPGDIAKKYYGKRGLGVALAEFNKVDPSKLKVGMKLRVPPIEVLDPTVAPTFPPAPTGDATAPLAQMPTQAPESPAVKTVRVREGDTLFAISKRVYGTGNRWKEIAAANGLGDGKNMKVGMELKIASH